jgi:hypothetical protein
MMVGEKISRKYYCLLILLTISFSCIAQVKDTLYFRNGSLLVGELKSLSLGKAVFDEDNMDVLSIKINQIRTLKALTHIYRLETIDGDIYYTSLEAARDGYVRIRTDTSQIDIRMNIIMELIPLSGKTGSLWQGSASAGYNYSKSAGTGQFNSSFSVEHLTKKIDLLFSGSAIINQTDSSAELSNATGTISSSYLFTPVWESNVFVVYQRNLQQGLARRFQEGLGGGCNFITSASVRVKAITGMVFNQELSIEGVESPTQLDIPVMFNFSFFRFSKPDLTVNLQEKLFFGITQKGRIRQDGQLSFNWKFIQDFYINLQFYHNYDNQPPGENSERLDYGIVFGLSYKFSQ